MTSGWASKYCKNIAQSSSGFISNDWIWNFIEHLTYKAVVTLLGIMKNRVNCIFWPAPVSPCVMPCENERGDIKIQILVKFDNVTMQYAVFSPCQQCLPPLIFLKLYHMIELNHSIPNNSKLKKALPLECAWLQHYEISDIQGSKSIRIFDFLFRN